MRLPTDIIEHDGETFHVGYEEYLTCGACGEYWDVTSPDDEDENYRTGPKGDTRCRGCGATHRHTYIKKAHYYTKYDAIPLSDPPLEAKAHADALRWFAGKIEALEANGWEIVDSDGIHIHLEKRERESTDSPHKITESLE